MSSIGQRPNSFFNSFPNGIQLGEGAEVSLIGYSGNVNGDGNVTTGEPYDITIQTGENDTFTVIHGGTGAVADQVFPPFKVVVPSGIYDPTSFAATLTTALNNAERISNYKGNWAVTYAGIPNFKYTIKSVYGIMDNAQQLGGQFVNYNGGDDGVANGAPSTVLTPYPNHLSFIDTKAMAIGNSGQAFNSVAAEPNGVIMEFTTIADAPEDCAVTLCMVPDVMATKMKYKGAGNEPILNSDLEYTGECAPELDFAYGNSGAETYGFTPHGITVRYEDGQIGIIQATTQNMTGAMKDGLNWKIRWTEQNVGTIPAEVKSFGISTRMNAGALTCEYLFFTGGAWTLLTYTGGASTAQVISGAGAGENATFRYASNYFAGVVYDPDTASRATALPVTISRIAANAATTPAAPADLNGPFPCELGFMPYDDLNPSLASISSGMLSASRASNKLGQSIGFPQPFKNIATAGSVGFISKVAIAELNNNGEYSPLLITCRDLPIVGYIGGAQGTTSPLLGVGRIRGNDINFGFSSEVSENWIQLRNTEPLTLYRLGIDVMTESNKAYVGLESNFSVWLKFRSNGMDTSKRSSVMGISSRG